MGTSGVPTDRPEVVVGTVMVRGTLPFGPLPARATALVVGAIKVVAVGMQDV